MNVSKALALLAILATIWGVTYMHDRDHRYDIVAAGGGGGGGSNTDTGDTGSIDAYVIDHQTGEVWYHHMFAGIPTMIQSCEDAGGVKVAQGCKRKADK